MKLYHGSNVSIETIDLKRGRKGKDFGQGFYLSADRNQAQMMAERTVDREESGKATLTTFEFDEDILKNHTTMKVKVFEGYSKEWAEFKLQYIQMDELIRQLSFVRPTFQFFFGTKRAIRLLHKIENDE